MSITNDSTGRDINIRLQLAIEHIETAVRKMNDISSYSDPAGGITDADWLEQIAELLREIHPETRSARCPECGSSQLIYCEEVNLHHRLIDANEVSWRFSGDSDPQETGHWRIECEACGHELCTQSEARGFADVNVICDGVVVAVA